MRIESVSVQVLETPVSLEYTAAGNDVSSNWHVLARLRTDDGIEGIGWVVANRGGLVRAMASAAAELGDLLVGLNVLDHEAACQRMSRASSWVGPGGMATMAMSALDIAQWGRGRQNPGRSFVPTVGRGVRPGSGLRLRRPLVQHAHRRPPKFGPRSR